MNDKSIVVKLEESEPFAKENNDVRNGNKFNVLIEDE